MTTDDLDRELARLRDLADRIGANLVALEDDEHRQLLEVAPLHGDTAVQWEHTRVRLGELFAGYTQLRAFIDHASAARGVGRLTPDDEARLTSLLTGPTIDVCTAPVALHERRLLEGSTRVERCSADDLVARMSAAFSAVTAVLAAVRRAWDDLLPRLGTQRQELERVADRGAMAGDEWRRDVTAVANELDRIGRDLVGNPLAVDPDELDVLERRVAELAGEISDAERVRNEFGPRIAAARGFLDSLTGDLDRASRLQAEARLKVSGADLPCPPDISRALCVELDRLVASVGAGRWRTASDRLERWWAEAADAGRRVEEAHDQAAATLARRGELRGRLDAYTVKAGRLGRAEDPTLARLYDAAEQALYVAPADLDQAEALVRHYQEAITSPRAHQEVSR